MKRPWRVVHNSPNKRVLIRPRNRPRVPQPKPIHAAPVAPPADDWSWVGAILKELAPVCALFFVLWIIIAYWEIILVGMVIIGIALLFKK